MIELTKLNNSPFVLNAELIRYVECCPDTLITLTNGDSVMVRESMQEVMQKAIEYQREKHLFPVH